MQDILWCMSAVSFDSKYEMMKILGIPSKRWGGVLSLLAFIIGHSVSSPHFKIAFNATSSLANKRPGFISSLEISSVFNVRKFSGASDVLRICCAIV